MYIIKNVMLPVGELQWTFDIAKGQGTGKINFVHYKKVLLHQASFPCILLLLE